MELSVAIPIFNEQKILENTLLNFAAEFDAVVGPGRWAYVLVENGSADSTLEVARRMITKWPGSKVIELNKPDYGNALREGMLNADYPWTMILNIDHQWDTPFFKWAWDNRADYDMIMGSKSADLSLNSQTRYRKILSAGINALFRYYVDFSGADTHGMKVMRTEAVKPLAEVCIMRRGQFDSELVIRSLRKGLRTVEVPVYYSERRKQRNFMIKKIGQNVINLFTFSKEMRSVPQEGPLHYRRLSREDVEMGRRVV